MKFRGNRTEINPDMEYLAVELSSPCCGFSLSMLHFHWDND